MNVRKKTALAAAATMVSALALSGGATTASAATSPAAASVSTAAFGSNGQLPAAARQLQSLRAVTPNSYAAAWVPAPGGLRGRAWQTWYADSNRDGGYWGHYGATTDTDSGVSVERFIYYDNGTSSDWTVLTPGATYYYYGASSVWFAACDAHGCGQPIEL